MTIKRLKQILETENVQKDTISFSDPVLVEATGCLRKTDAGWQFYVLERGEKRYAVDFKTEAELCDYVLEDLSYSYKQLKKYIPQSETA